jgi:hypothetical protein
MPSFEITLFVEPDDKRDAEIEIIRIVEAREIDEALELARKLREELPGIDQGKVTAWFIAKRED